MSKNENYLKKANFCLLVYDITEKKSFEEIKDYFFEKLKEKCQKDIIIFLIGNKSDLFDKRKVTTEEAIAFAYINHLFYFETSCFKNYENIKYIFDIISSNILNGKMINHKKLKNHKKRRDRCFY